MGSFNFDKSHLFTFLVVLRWHILWECLRESLSCFELEATANNFDLDNLYFINKLQGSQQFCFFLVKQKNLERHVPSKVKVNSIWNEMQNFHLTRTIVFKCRLSLLFLHTFRMFWGKISKNKHKHKNMI